MMPAFPDTGKIQDAFFQSLVFPFCGSPRPEVSIPPAYGADTAIVRLPNDYEMALTSDPLSLIPTLGLRESAWLSVQLMANDMVTTGKAPMYAQFVLNLPPSLGAEDFGSYWQHIHHFCAAMGTAITGGHTGRVEGINATVAGGGTMITIAAEGTLLSSTGARPGDAIVITKDPALVAASILSLSFPGHVRQHCGQEVQQQAAGLFYETSALQAGLAAASLNSPGNRTVTAMHDVTEGGILGAVFEMAQASGCGVLIDKERLPSGAASSAVCRLFGIDPLYSVGAGSLIIAVQAGEEQRLIDTLKQQGINATAAGVFTAAEEGLWCVGGEGQRSPLLHPGTDPYWNAFYTAFAQGLK